jgi:hypothetical protein
MTHQRCVENEQLRQRSGEVDSDDPLVSFLYGLMRDHLPATTVESLVVASPGYTTTLYTNGWLALYAKDLAARLRKPTAPGS